MDDNDRLDVMRAVTATNMAVLAIVKKLRDQLGDEGIGKAVDELNKSQDSLALILKRMEEGSKNG